MTAKKRSVVNAKRKTKAAAGAVKRAAGAVTRDERKLSEAQVDAQIAALEEKIALLKEGAGSNSPRAGSKAPKAGSSAQGAGSKIPRAGSSEQSAESSAQSAESRAQEAERRAQEAERRAQEAESNAQEAESNAANAESRAQEAESNAQEAERRAQEAEISVPSAGSKVPRAGSKVPRAGSSAQSAGSKIPRAGISAQGAGPHQSASDPSIDAIAAPSANLPAQRANLPAQRANLPAPVLGELVANGPSSITIHWSPVANAASYIISIADNPEWDEANLFSAGPAAVSWTVNGLQADTTYYVRVRATGSGEYGNSAYSTSKSITTTAGAGEIPGGGDGSGGGSGETDIVVGELQNWLEQMQFLFQNTAQYVPQLDTIDLDSTVRRRLLGSGVRRYGFIDKVSDTAEMFPQFWPASVHGVVDLQDGLKDRLREIEVLRNVLLWLRYMTRAVGDLLLLAGDDAFRMANTYYASVRSAARSNLPGAVTVYQLLKLFWTHRRRTTSEPTEQEILRDAKGLMHGTKAGNITLGNESGRFIKGKKLTLDETFPVKQHGGLKFTEEELRE